MVIAALFSWGGGGLRPPSCTTPEGRSNAAAVGEHLIRQLRCHLPIEGKACF